VVAVEPQPGLRDLIEINCRINDLNNWTIQSVGLGPPGTDRATLHVYSPLNSGMSSIGRRYRSTSSTVEVPLMTGGALLDRLNLDQVSLMKVDVEGFEYAVVEGLADCLEAGRIRRLLIDYHTEIMASQGLSAPPIHQRLSGAGMSMLEGATDSGATSYALYEHSGV
jgi:FkbM family methyltransferase